MSAHDEDGGRRRRTLAKASTYSLDAVKTRRLQLHRSPGGAGGHGVIRVAAELVRYGGV
jgi:solute carrier family 25 (mitochondrial uncoupling protein), member 27